MGNTHNYQPLPDDIPAEDKVILPPLHIEKDTRAVLYGACLLGNEAKVMSMKDRFTTYDKYGKLPIHYLCFDDKDLPILKAIIKYCDPDAKTKSGLTPLYKAVCHGRMEIARCLLENGAHVDGFVISDATPFMKACEKGDIEMVKLLLDYKCKYYLKHGDTQMTGMHLACYMDRLQLVQYLLNRGLPFTKHKDKWFCTPYELAKKYDSAGIVKAIEVSLLSNQERIPFH